MGKKGETRAKETLYELAGTDRFEAVVDLAARRGFFQASAQIYGGLAGFFDYGPAGAAMRRKMEAAWVDYWTRKEEFFLIDTPTIGQDQVFRASGHLEKFSDPLVECRACGQVSRADHVKGEGGGLGPCPSCGKKEWSEPRQVNLMLSTQVGVSKPQTAYLRPETAQGIFWNFSTLLRHHRGKLPFGVAQIGLGYRNEIAPRNALIRMREFHMGEVEVFLMPKEKGWPRFGEVQAQESTFVDREGAIHLGSFGEMVSQGIIRSQIVGHFMACAYEILRGWGMPEEKVRFRQHVPEEMAHYAQDVWDLEVETSLGWIECVGIADRGDYDLTRHQTYSGADLSVFTAYPEPREVERELVVPDFKALGPKFRGDAAAVGEAMKGASPQQVGKDGKLRLRVNNKDLEIDANLFKVEKRREKVAGESVVPHVVEPSFGFDRLFFALLDLAYRRVVKESEPYTILALDPRVAPVTACVFPLMPKDDLDTIAQRIHRELILGSIDSAYDDGGSIGKRYARADEVGTPWCITVDYESKEDKAVTLRHRDTQVQERIPIAQVAARIRQLMARPPGGMA